MSQKRFLWLLILFVLLLGTVATYFIFANKKPSSVIPEAKISIPASYVKKTDDSANQATFVFAVSVKKEDIIGANVRYCVLGMSVGAERDGGQLDCKDASAANSFLLKYDETSQTLIVSDPTPGEWGPNSGPFRIGCASCGSAIEFRNIHTADGQLLSSMLVDVY